MLHICILFLKIFEGHQPSLFPNIYTQVKYRNVQDDVKCCSGPIKNSKYLLNSPDLPQNCSSLKPRVGLHVLDYSFIF